MEINFFQEPSNRWDSHPAKPHLLQEADLRSQGVEVVGLVVPHLARHAFSRRLLLRWACELFRTKSGELPSIGGKNPGESSEHIYFQWFPFKSNRGTKTHILKQMAGEAWSSCCDR